MARARRRSRSGWSTCFVIFGLIALIWFGVMKLTAPQDPAGDTSFIHDLAFYGTIITGIPAVICFLVGWLAPLAFGRRR